MEREYIKIKTYGVLIKKDGIFAIYVFADADDAVEYLNGLDIFGVENTPNAKVIDIFFDVIPRDVDAWSRYFYDDEHFTYIINKESWDFDGGVEQ